MLNALNQGAGSEASLPVTLRSRRSAPKLLFPQLSAKNPFLSVSVRPQKPFHHAPIERVAAAVQQEKQQQRI